MLNCQNLTLTYNQRIIFKDLGFCLGAVGRRGGCLIVRGGNGSGKTSLLKILCGLNRNHQGEVRFAEHNILDIYGDYCADLQYIGHENALKDYLSVRQNLEFYANLHDSRVLIPAALKYFRLEKYGDILLSKLSAGLKRRVALARLICCPAHIWFLDEPGSNLDQDNKKSLIDLIATRVAEGGIVVLTTHDEVFNLLVEAGLASILDLEDYAHN